MSEFKGIRIEINENITKLTCELNTLNAGMLNLDSKIIKCTELLSNLDKYYEQRDVIRKQHIISLIFPSKLVFDNKIVRTLEVNKVVSLICSYNKGSRKNNKGKHTNFGVLSLGVESEGFEPSSKQGINKLSSCLAFN